jgi:CxxC motif-containing protein
MQKKITCIACPVGCRLTIELENNQFKSVSGNKCDKGKTYAQQEIENPTRTLSSTIRTVGLELKMLPVRTAKPIPKSQLFPAMEEIRNLSCSHPVKAGEIIQKNFLGLGVDLIATRSAK